MNPPSDQKQYSSLVRQRYSLNTGVLKQPCCKPYESDDDTVTNGMRLDFNYWINNRSLVDQQVQDIIMSILNDDCNSFIRLRQSFQIKHVVVVTLQGVDPMKLQLDFSLLPFLNKLSYMPIRHTTTSTDRFHDNLCDVCGENQWHPAKVVPMNTLLLWTEQPPVRVGNRFMVDSDEDNCGPQSGSASTSDCTATVEKLFRDSILLFKVGR